MSEPQYVAETLAWCNKRRAETGMKPLERLPKGQRGNARSCPCGAATGLYVHAASFRESRDPDAQRWPIPRAVTEFVTAFDGGRLPQYEEDEA